MTTSYYDPFREFGRAINSAFRTPGSVGMPMDLYRDKEAFVANIDLPGVDPDSIDIDIEENTLTVRAERRATVTSEDTEWLTRERSTGTYARQLSLGNGVALDQIEANYNDGVLTITLPIAEQAKPRKVTVTRSNVDHKVHAEVED
ncbi:Hsp20/alpha crystallin family protein [uncultured Tessaracoccus sp.]|uniref:Hsp20/alpha crystallin family protein n=1 Tax=uncultured Tessaracoccus sp. TaxID=905023 RepID=UPI0026161F2D|nr:Hsp20/alpha crystallin family protein [uncultured Tessaracoccus sp.]